VGTPWIPEQRCAWAEQSTAEKVASPLARDAARAKGEESDRQWGHEGS
jgi:hypothetical protein